MSRRRFPGWTTRHLSCPDCGTREALDSIGVSPEEQDSIIQTIHRYQQSE